MIRTSLLRRFSPLGLLVFGFALGCSGPADDSGTDTGELQSDPAPVVEDLAVKLGETPALKPGALGVHSWVSYLALMKNDELGIIAYGVDLDGANHTVLSRGT